MSKVEQVARFSNMFVARAARGMRNEMPSRESVGDMLLGLGL